MKRGIKIKATNQLLCDLFKLPNGSHINYIAQSSEDYCEDTFTIIIEGTDERFPEWQEGMVVKSGTLVYESPSWNNMGDCNFTGVTVHE